MFAQQVGSTTLTQGVKLVLALATASITARWLGPEGKGQVAILLLIPAMLQLFLNFGMGAANVYHAGSRRLPVAKLTANSVMFSLLGTIVGILVVVALLAGGGLGVIVPGVATGCVLLGMVALPLNLLIANLNSVLQGIRRIFTLNMLSILQAAIVIPFMAVFVIWLGMGVPGAVIASLLAYAATVLAAGWCLRRDGARFWPRWDPQVIRPTLGFGMKSYVGNLLQFFNYRLDTFLVNFFLGPAAVGIYGVSVALAELLWQFPNAVSIVMFPKAAGSSHDVLNRFTPRVFWIVLAVTAAGAVGLALFGRLAIRIVFSSAFIDAYMPLLALLPGVVCLGAAKVLSHDIMGRGFPQYNSIVAGLSLLITITLDVLLIPTMGVLGASLASTAAYTMTLFLTVGFYLMVSRRPAAGTAA